MARKPVREQRKRQILKALDRFQQQILEMLYYVPGLHRPHARDG